MVFIGSIPPFNGGTVGLDGRLDDAGFDEVVGPADATDVGREAINGDLFPSIFGAFTIPENHVEDCVANEAKFPGASFNAHKSLVFENL